MGKHVDKLSDAIRSAEDDPNGGKVLLTLDDARALLENYREMAETLAGLLPALSRLDHHDREMFADEEMAAWAALTGGREQEADNG